MSDAGKGTAADAVAVSGIWLRATGASGYSAEVLAEIGGVWRVVIPPQPITAGPVSHIVEPPAMLAAPVDPVTAAAQESSA